MFGLSTTLHLLQRGYTNIHLFDRQPFDHNHYDETRGGHGASCDLNKIIRASYGGQKLYQDLAFKAMPIWSLWNQELAASSKEILPESLDPEIPIWHNCGFLRLSDCGGVEEKEVETQANFPADIKHTQYQISDVKRREYAVKAGIPYTKVDPFGRLARELPVDGVLDMTAGYVLASRACTWALHKIQSSGHVRCQFGPLYALQSLIKAGTTVTGIVTADSTRHDADMVLIACGGWTPSLLPETQQLLETTSGSVLSIQLPKNKPDLWDKYDEKNFPVWSWNMGSYKHGDSISSIGGLYGLPRTPEGIVKVAFRGAKWTSYTRSSSSGTKVSYPEPDVDEIPEEAMRVIRSFVAENLPDLLELDLSNCRLCWYTDSIDNDWLIDHVPGVQGLVVASGGSGHGFKFLPVLGEHIVDVMEGKETEYTRLFQWRTVPTGKRNGLEEGLNGWRTLHKHKMAGNTQWREGLE